ncbi:homogentisate 1,2-dioxygenase [Microthyrium microscopicum]|uniref:homogentisate 1,2-dioxygenase n=1 Tax=Microthyrium microscopicum TaxID=703497 RepID=A0A6A6U8U5_9PEZI|nr:homogentisate 1,2-dioxygenase [Microthyrium microscopicum]
MPVTNFSTPEKYTYLPGFATYHESEAIPNTIPIAQNAPQKPAHGLYAEKLSGTAFTAPRHENQQAWLYRIVPASAHSSFDPLDLSPKLNPPTSENGRWHQIPNQLRWSPFDLDDQASWVDGMHLVAGAGDAALKHGLGILVFAVGKSMERRTAYYSADGDALIVLQHGVLDVTTEFGKILVRPGEIFVIPRGIRYRVDLPDGPARGYILELYSGHFALPELGPIGTNGLANGGDFQCPVAAFEEDFEDGNTYTLVAKFAGKLFRAKQDHTPFDVVGWKGNYYPYKYDLGRFNTMGTISYDHPDPSIFTVLTAQSDKPGTAIADFVIFPPRWLVGEDTFRPPYYHRNCMSEFMGMICGEYDAKIGGGFLPAGASLHNVMSAHGPDAETHKKASEAPLKPVKVGEGSMAFMFESCLMVGVTEWGLHKCDKVQEDYNKESWEGLKGHFKRPDGEAAR